jgi:N-acetyltransferase
MVQDPHQRRATVAGEEIVLTGSEVVLIPLTRSHCSTLERVAGEFAQKKPEYPFSFVPLTAADVRSYVDAALHQREAGERYPFAVQWNRTIVGSTSYAALDFWTWPEESAQMRRRGPDAVEIGATWIAPSAQRTRCNTESKFLLLIRTFEDWKVHRVTLKTDERNSRSRRAIERIGANSRVCAGSTWSAAMERREIRPITRSSQVNGPRLNPGWSTCLRNMAADRCGETSISKCSPACSRR